MLFVSIRIFTLWTRDLRHQLTTLRMASRYDFVKCAHYCFLTGYSTGIVSMGNLQSLSNRLHPFYLDRFDFTVDTVKLR